MKIKIRTISTATVIVLSTILLVSGPTPFPLANSLLFQSYDISVTYAQNGVPFRAQQVIAELQAGAKPNDISRRYDLTMRKNLGDNQYMYTWSDSRSVDAVVVQVSRDRDVILVEPNYLVALDQLGTDQRSGAFIDQRSGGFINGVSPADFFDQYAMTLIRATDAHAITTGSGVIVSVVDTGVDTNHPVFTHVMPGYDFVDSDGDPSETGNGAAFGHGTHVAGVVALVAPDVTIMPVRAFDSTGYGDASSLASAIRYAADNGADVLNMSFSMAGKEPKVLKSAVSYATNRGLVLVASVGNQNSSSPRYPAKDVANNVIAVAATDSNDRKASFSNYGAVVKVCAPGVSIYSAYPGGLWAWWDGTSFAAPMVSGEAALLLSQGRTDVRNVIQSATVSVPDSQMGSGRIDCYAAVTR